MNVQNENNELLASSLNEVEASSKEKNEDLESDKEILSDSKGVKNDKHDLISNSGNIAITQQVELKYILYRRRWLVLVLFIAVSYTHLTLPTNREV